MSLGGIRRLWATVLVAVLSLTLVPATTGAPADSPPSTGAVAAGDASVPDSWIVTLRPGADAGRDATGLAVTAGGRAGHVYQHVLNGFAFTGSERAASALASNPNVRTVIPDRPLKAVAETLPPGIRRIDAEHPTQPDAHDSGFKGLGARIAILDTGIDLSHPDLSPNIDAALGKNCKGAGPPQDGHGHGTHVAGIAAAVAGNGLGVVGVAPQARLVPVKVLDDTGSGTWADVICGIDYVTGLATDADSTNDVQVANMSLGDTGPLGSCTDGGLHQAICQSVAAGIVYTVAAGNSMANASTFVPAAFPEVITVSAMTDFDGEPGGLAGCQFILVLLGTYCDDAFANFSNYGAIVDVTAPGVQVYSTWTGGSYQTESGTSMAAPHVAGVAALVRAANPALSPADVEALLKANGECPDGTWVTGTCAGHGQWTNDPDGFAEPLVNALRAAQAAGAWDPLPTVKITNPADGSAVSGTVNVTANATDDKGIIRVDFFVNGSLAASDLNGSDGWAMTWDTASLAPGTYTLLATATDTANQSTGDHVSVNVGPSVQGNWVGTFGAQGYVLGGWYGNSDLGALPPATLVLEQGSRWAWTGTAAVRALQHPTQAVRRAATFYHDTQLRLRLNFTNAYGGDLHLYALDWDTTARRENVTVNDGSGPRTVNLTAAFDQGVWLHFPISVGAGGSVTVTVDRIAGLNAVLGGLFLGGAGTPPAPPPPPPYEQGTQGDWVGSYGGDGYVLGAWNKTTDLVSLPNAKIVVVQGSRKRWASPTTNVRALENATETERRAATYYDDTQLRLRLDFTSAYSGTLHLYALDWDTTARRENVTVNDGSGPQTVAITTAFNGGAWLHFPISVGAGGSVTITVDRIAGLNAVLGGLFLGGGGPPP